MWLTGVVIHAVHICVFTYRNLIRKRDINTFVPSWFVTYNGIMVSYLNVEKHSNQVLLFLLYACVLASLVFILVKLPKFFSFSFAPGFAGMTFPMCIGIVATNKMTAYLAETGREGLSALTAQLSGIQVYLTTMIVGYVLLNFLIMALRINIDN